MEQFNLQEWKLRELQKYNNMTNRHTFRATAMQTYSSEEQRLTLADGRVILAPEEGKWIGKPITLEDGTSLPPGEYTLADARDSSGRVIVIGKDGNVKEVREPEIKTRATAMYNNFTIEHFFEWKKKELAKLPENRQLRKQAIDNLSQKVENLKRSISKP